MECSGMTLLEVVVSLFIVSISIAGYTQMFSMALNAQGRVSSEIIATNLARGLMEEIMAKNFVDTVNPVWGPETGESRATFDDVDDYNGYIAAPPRTVTDQLMNGQGGRPNYSDYSVAVTVQWFDYELDGTVHDPALETVTGPTNYKKVTVTVTYGGRTFQKIMIKSNVLP